MTIYHLTGTLRGTDATEVWIVDSRITHHPPFSERLLPQRGTVLRGWRRRPSSPSVVSDSRSDVVVDVAGFIYPGLVDAHTHPGLLHGPGLVTDAEIVRRLTMCCAQGVTHIREMGAQRDVAGITDPDSIGYVPGLPKVIRAGRHIARPMRYIRYLPVEIEPRDLPAEALRQLARSDGWVKIVGDWIDRSEGASADLRTLWPREILVDAVTAVHEAGGRVAVHAFGTDTIDDLLEAGVDSIEHGSGMTRDHLVEARERGTLIDPTARQIATFSEIASHARRYPVYREHMLAMHARRAKQIQLMVETGSHFIMGSDTAEDVAERGMAVELQCAVGDGMPASVAMAAASFAGRRCLGLPSWEEGSPADLVVYDRDPEADIAVVAHPAAVFIDGVRF